MKTYEEVSLVGNFNKLTFSALFFFNFLSKSLWATAWFYWNLSLTTYNIPKSTKKYCSSDNLYIWQSAQSLQSHYFILVLLQSLLANHFNSQLNCITPYGNIQKWYLLVFTCQWKTQCFSYKFQTLSTVNLS